MIHAMSSQDLTTKLYDVDRANAVGSILLRLIGWESGQEARKVGIILIR
jgi:hypothetical protein